MTLSNKVKLSINDTGRVLASFNGVTIPATDIVLDWQLGEPAECMVKISGQFFEFLETASDVISCDDPSAAHRGAQVDAYGQAI